MTRNGSRELPLLTDFHPEDPQAEIPDRSGHFEIMRKDDRGRFVYVEAYIGYRRPSGPTGTMREPNTLYIQDVQVTEGQHLGAAALYLGIRHAQQAAAARGKTLREGRMQIINPKAVWTLEKLVDMKLVEAAFYRANGDSTPHRLPPTHGFEDRSDLLSAAEAAAYLEAQDTQQTAGAVPEQLGAVCCKFIVQADVPDIPG